MDEKNFAGNLKSLLWRISSNLFNFFTVTFKGFCRNNPERLLRQVHLSAILAWNIGLFFGKIVIIFLGRDTPNNAFLDVTNKETNNVM